MAASDKRFINGQQLGFATNPDGAPTSSLFVQTVAGTSDYILNPSFKCRVLDVRGIMTGAGDTSDTVVVKKNSTAITDTIDVSALGDKDTFLAAEIDDAQWDIGTSDVITVTTASDALCYLEIRIVRV